MVFIESREKAMDKGNKFWPDRRGFLRTMATLGAVMAAPDSLWQTALAEQTPVAAKAKAVKEIFFDIDNIHKWDNSQGDTWDPFWADDDQLYAFNCDGRGFGSNVMNLAFNRLAGDSPSSLLGSQINQMHEYGKAGQEGPDTASWKVCGQECIDNVFYAFVSRDVYGSQSKDPLLRQLSLNASLIKSTDRGLTWTRSAKDNYDHPMWPGAAFGAPFFIHYGRNGGQVSQDGANEYVYAVSTNGFWNDGDSLVLARIRRLHLPRLNALDWEYYAGGDGDIAANWSNRIENAAAILNRPAKCGQTPICYVPTLGIYLLISWYNTEKMTKWFEPNEMIYDFYQASHPWGPWTFVSSQNDRFMGPGYHMYGPSICAKFQEQHGSDIKVSLFTSGCPFEDYPITPYKMWHVPLVLRTTPLPRNRTITASDKKIIYHGFWFPLATIESDDKDKLPRATQAPESSAELSFYGTGIEYIVQKTKGNGSVHIYLDGIQVESANLDLDDFPVFFGVVAFAKHNMPMGKHIIKIVNDSKARVNLEAFRVYT
jgi:hypothetical protein